MWEVVSLRAMVTIVKADGTSEAFDISKLKRSLRRSGANRSEVAEIGQQVEAEIKDGMTTHEIYSRAFELLRDSEQPVAARYSLRRALFGLGPTGFPFEDFLARLFTKEGYTTNTRQMLPGKCATHEVDVTAYKEDDSFVAEAKFHSRPGIKSDLQVVMYSFARQLDLQDQKICNRDICGVKKLLVVTNTKFTLTAEDYAECSGIPLLSWDYPKNNNLHDRIQRVNIYPITVLQTLSAAQKRALIERNVIICEDIVKKPHLLRHTHISTKKTEAVLSEARQLCDK